MRTSDEKDSFQLATEFEVHGVGNTRLSEHCQHAESLSPLRSSHDTMRCRIAGLRRAPWSAATRLGVEDRQPSTDEQLRSTSFQNVAGFRRTYCRLHCHWATSDQQKARNSL